RTTLRFFQRAGICLMRPDSMKLARTRSSHASSLRTCRAYRRRTNGGPLRGADSAHHQPVVVAAADVGARCRDQRHLVPRVSRQHLLHRDVGHAVFPGLDDAVADLRLLVADHVYRISWGELVEVPEDGRCAGLAEVAVTGEDGVAARPGLCGES